MLYVSVKSVHVFRLASTGGRITFRLTRENAGFEIALGAGIAIHFIGHALLRSKAVDSAQFGHA